MMEQVRTWWDMIVAIADRLADRNVLIPILTIAVLAWLIYVGLDRFADNDARRIELNVLQYESQKEHTQSITLFAAAIDEMVKQNETQNALEVELKEKMIGAFQDREGALDALHDSIDSEAEAIRELTDYLRTN